MKKEIAPVTRSVLHPPIKCQLKGLDREEYDMYYGV